MLTFIKTKRKKCKAFEDSWKMAMAHAIKIKEKKRKDRS